LGDLRKSRLGRPMGSIPDACPEMFYIREPCWFHAKEAAQVIGMEGFAARSGITTFTDKLSRCSCVGDVYPHQCNAIPRSFRFEPGPTRSCTTGCLHTANQKAGGRTAVTYEDFLHSHSLFRHDSC
jgi:hypothetical protein